MKMEIPVEADEEVEIIELLAVAGGSVRAGQALAVVRRRVLDL
jgi:biotin carboxyl carrier protein